MGVPLAKGLLFHTMSGSFFKSSSPRMLPKSCPVSSSLSVSLALCKFEVFFYENIIM